MFMVTHSNTYLHYYTIDCIALTNMHLALPLSHWVLLSMLNLYTHFMYNVHLFNISLVCIFCLSF